MKKMSWTRRLAFLGGGLLGCAQAAAAPQYRIDALDLEIDGKRFIPQDINARSGIAGCPL